MTQFCLAFGARIRNVLLCALVTLPLAACDGSSGSGSSAASSSNTDARAALVAPNTGMIDRSQGLNGNDAAPANTPAGAHGSSAGSSNTTSNGTSAGTVTKAGQPNKTSSGVATLDWMPPTENNDGTLLTNLAGYTVYYGTSPSNLTQSVKVSNPGLASYTVTGLTAGTWYFAVSSYSADGVESTRTSTVSTII